MATLVAAIAALTLIEFFVLLLMHRRSGRGVAPKDFALNLFSGLALMAALWCVLMEIEQRAVLACLLVAGTLHALDIRNRWRR